MFGQKKKALQKNIAILRGLIAVLAVGVAAMSLYHFKLFTPGTPDIAAGIAEVLICAALVISLILSQDKPPKKAVKPVFKALLFSLLLTVLGVTIVLLTFTPKLWIDLSFHLTTLVLFATGLTLSNRIK